MLLAAADIADHGQRSGGRPGGILFLLLFIGLISFLLIRRKRHSHGVGHHHGGGPMAHLQQRFATGEINQAEFEHRRAVLRGDKNIPAAPADMAPPPPPTPTDGSSAPDDLD